MGEGTNKNLSDYGKIINFDLLLTIANNMETNTHLMELLKNGTAKNGTLSSMTTNGTEGQVGK